MRELFRSMGFRAGSSYENRVWAWGALAFGVYLVVLGALYLVTS